LSSQLVIRGQSSQILLKPQRLEDPRIDPQGHRRIPLLGTIESLSRKSGALRHRFRRVTAPQPGKLEIGPDLIEQALETR
jgi:hypothetical protein